MCVEYTLSDILELPTDGVLVDAGDVAVGAADVAGGTAVVEGAGAAPGRHLKTMINYTVC